MAFGAYSARAKSKCWPRVSLVGLLLYSNQSVRTNHDRANFKAHRHIECLGVIEGKYIVE